MTRVPASDLARELIDRIRPGLPRGELREVRMFGVIALMVDDVMTVAVHRDGSLLVRVDPAEDALLLGRPGASRPEMGAGRSMGPGWIRVEAEALEGAEGLSTWLDAAARHRTRATT